MTRPCDTDVAAGTTPPGSLIAVVQRRENGEWEVVHDGNVYAVFARDEHANACDFRNGFNAALTVRNA